MKGNWVGSLKLLHYFPCYEKHIGESFKEP